MTKPDNPQQKPCEHVYRLVDCTGDFDTVQCEKCGHKKIVKCTFDDDFA